MTNSPSWYKQGWPWFLIALPGAAVIASFISLAIAMQHADSALQDNYSKQGFAIERDVRRDAAAAQQQLQAELVFAANGAVDLALHSALAADNTQPPLLTLNFIHPLDAHLDFNVPLQRTAAGKYRGQLPARAPSRWIVELSAPAQAWRLRASIDLQQQSAAQPSSFHLSP